MQPIILIRGQESKTMIPEDVKYIIKKLNQNQEQAYIVGGCVRDFLLGRRPEDWDITTSAKPSKVKQLFHKTIDTGIEHGTVTVMIRGTGYEVTTYRIDGDYVKHRKPEQVQYTESLVQDLARRDFTINAMAYHPEQGMIDCYGGEKDLDEGIIRCVGNPEHRFQEDALRMLRAIRFSAKLGFEIEAETMAAIRHNAKLIQYVSAERIQTELSKALLGNYPQRMETLADSGLLQYLVPELKGQFINYKAIRRAESIYVKTAIWLLPVRKQGIAPKLILKRLKYDNKTIRWVMLLTDYFDYEILPEAYPVKQVLSQIGMEGMEMLLAMWQAYQQGLLEYERLPEEAQATHQANQGLIQVEQIEQLVKAIIDSQACISLGQLKINGRDIIQQGVTGPRIGVVLDYLLDQVLQDERKNQSDVLLQMARAYLEKN